MTTLLTKLLSGAGIVSVIFITGFIFGYHTKSNQVNSVNAKQDIKLATLQSKYDELANLAQQQYFNGEEQINESNPNFYNSNKHDFMWHIFNFNHITNTLCKGESTKGITNSTAQSIKNGKLNTLKLIELQNYIKGIIKLQNE